MRNRDIAVGQRGLLTRLRRSTSGNTLIMAAVALIPLSAMAGSGLDMSRAYLVKSRLQAACDAGALATRKAMNNGTAIDANALAQGQSFFSNNFPTDTYGVTNLSFTPALDTDRQVLATATAKVPMSLMKMFGFNDVNLNLTCKAMLEVSNADVMMVLDVTGSMGYTPDDVTYIGNGSGSKIFALRQSTVDFFNTINNATSSDARFRIGFVPYSSAVNMGIDPFTGAQLLPANWQTDSWTYQSRVANMTTPGYSPTTTYGNWTSQTFGSKITNSDCTKYGNNQSFSGFTPNAGWNQATPTNDVFSAGQPPTVTNTYSARVTGSYSGSQNCTRQYRTATTTYAQNGRFGFTSWDYKPVTLNVQNYRAGAPVNLYTGAGAPAGSVTVSKAYDMFELVNSSGSTVVGSSTNYDGCVEERSTVVTGTYAPMPAGAWDLDVATVPYDNATKWRPMWPEMVYARGVPAAELNSANTYGRPASYCSAQAASKLATRTTADVQSYVDDLNPDGSTYHDLGMVWGIRMLSSAGLWGSENTTAPNNKPISRHLLFLTDGAMAPRDDIYSAQAYEDADRKLMGSTTPTPSNMTTRHNARFQALCDLARSHNISVWTVAFGTSAPTNLTACADPGQSYVATDAAALQAQFQLIASKIAKLRLSK